MILQNAILPGFVSKGDRPLVLRQSLVALLIGPALAASIAFANDYVIDTVAGTGQADNNGDRGHALQINVGDPFGVEVGPELGLYFTEVRNHRVWKLDLQSQQVTVVAGSGRKGFAGDGGPATDAELNEPYEVRFDAAGNMYFVEMQNHLVRRVDAKTGRISTVAGTGSQGYGGDGGPARQAQLNNPHSIALDSRGGLLIADIGNHRIRRVDLQTGEIVSIAGSEIRSLPVEGQLARGNPVLGPRALAIVGSEMWVALREGHSVWKLDLDRPVWQPVAGTGHKGYEGDGGRPAESTFNGPKGIAVGPTGRIYVVDTENHAIREIDVAEQRVRTVAGGQLGSQGDGGPARNAGMNRPHGICVAPDGTIYVGDTLNHRIRRLTPR